MTTERQEAAPKALTPPRGKGAWPRPLAWLVLQLLALWIGLMCALWCALALLLVPLLPHAWGRRVGRAAIAWIFRVSWAGASATGLLRIQANVLRALAHEPGLVIVANHPSLLDAPMLVAQLPRSFCVMKAELMRNPLLATGALLARYIRNDHPRAIVRQAVADLREGGQLVMFPEGTRTTGALPGPFHGGFALIASRARVPVQTVFIDTDSPYLGKDWPLWKLPPLPIEFSLRMGRRFEPSPEAHADVGAWAQEIERYMAAHAHRLPPRANA